VGFDALSDVDADADGGATGAATSADAAVITGALVTTDAAGSGAAARGVSAVFVAAGRAATTAMIDPPTTVIADATKTGQRRRARTPSRRSVVDVASVTVRVDGSASIGAAGAATRGIGSIDGADAGPLSESGAFRAGNERSLDDGVIAAICDCELI
jgi:hypothetical protein